jgi:hypothetical protein
MNEPTNDKGADAGEGAAAGEAMDWEQRRLCSDGNCIGVIGADGRCKECGRPEAGQAETFDVEPPAPSAPESAEEPSAADGTDGDWQQRRLCSDGNCIGVIGADGRCKECGKPPAE